MFRGYHKYNAKKTEIDGFVFDSKKEAARYQELKVLEQAMEIHDLELQPEFFCIVNGRKVCKYRADFRYVQDGTTIIEDVKGMRTDVYKLKKKLVEALYDIEIQEI